MTQLEKTLIRLYRHGYDVETIAQSLGEDKCYVGYILDCYFGWTRPERVDPELAAAVRPR